MSAACQTVCGTAGWSELSFALAPPGGLDSSPAQLGPVGTAAIRVRRFLEALKDARRKCPAGRPGPEEPREEHAAADSIWDDPSLWMLMLH